MRLQIYTLGLALVAITALQAQTGSQTIAGKVSFTTSRNVYVRFEHTDPISVGDTLLWSANNVPTPCLLVTQKSSSSCVCTILNDCNVQVDESIFFAYDPPTTVQQKARDQNEEVVLPSPKNPVVTRSITQATEPQEQIRGRLSAASYSNFSANAEARHRTMYRLSFSAENINNSKFSVETYLNYRQNILSNTEITGQPTKFFRVYNLAARYDVDSTISVILGRKINNKISSLGAIDGLQIEKWFGQSYIGGVAGFRPDIFEFGFNTKLFQYGAYIGRAVNNNTIYAQTTLGLLEQRNTGQIDRRYAYFQHSSRIGRKLNLFGSLEVDIYDKVNEVVGNQPRLTNLYVSARYRFSRKVNVSIAYDSRKQILFYETLRTEIERLLADDESRQGLRFRVHVRPLKYLTIGAGISRRFQTSQQNKSDNINGFVSWTKVPRIGGRLTLNVNMNTSNYFRNRIVSLRHSSTLLQQKLTLDVYYRLVNYHFFDDRLRTNAHYAGTGISYRLNRKLRLGLLGEYAIKPTDNTFRINFRIIRRF